MKDDNFEKAQSLYQQGYNLKMVHEIMKKEGIQEELIVEATCKLKLLIYKKRKSRGVFIMALGGVLLILGFVLTVFLFHANSEFNYIMYGFTMVGTGLMCWGGYEVLQ